MSQPKADDVIRLMAADFEPTSSPSIFTHSRLPDVVLRWDVALKLIDAVKVLVAEGRAEEREAVALELHIRGFGMKQGLASNEIHIVADEIRNRKP